MRLGFENHKEFSTRNHGFTVADFLTLEILNKILNWEHGDPYSHDLKCNNRIPEIPINMKERNPRAYVPRNVSIGPYHYGDPQLDRMQVDKMRALRHFVKRGRHPMETYLEALMEVVTPCRESYGQLEKQWQDETHFCLLMLIDGVFVLEFLSVTRGNQNNYDYAATDPIFGHEGHMLIYGAIMQDLLMVENQLPYLVLSTLLSVSEGLPEQSIHNILSWMMFAPNIDPGLHLLDMYLKGLLADGQRAEAEEEEEDQQQEYRIGNIAASKLCKRGVKFVAVQSYAKMRLDKNTGTLLLPTIHITKQNISKILNMIAFERREGTNKDFNSYIDLLDSLIQSPKDVNQLRSQGIIVNSSSSDETVMDLIKEITKDAVRGVMDSRSNLVRQDIIEYCQTGAGTRICRKSPYNLKSVLRRSSDIFSHLPSQREFLKLCIIKFN
ncbi:hypothetical protein MKW94_005994 [Papaver nudicaule]|uniref:Uncharacterized protein n=1 Tax=Papaver nudicaule TaxID=74823 RepID=A0AA41VB79_PAPNU|nr:hypothetical protein [Papaver nudicaule]